MGLEYLTLDRLASTLSGGEAQRIQLATSLGSRLVGALYVLDEPSIGLHTRDTERLIRILERAARPGKHDSGGGARRRHSARGRSSARPGAGRGRVRRQAAGRRRAGGDRGQSGVADGALFEREDFDSRAHAAARAGTREAGAARGAGQQSARAGRGDSAGDAGGGDGRFRLGQIDAGAPGAVSRGGAGAGADAMAAIRQEYSVR